MDVPKVVGELIILTVLVVWVVFWASVTLLNYSLGDLVGTALTAVVFVISTAALLLWRLRDVGGRLVGA